MQTFQDLVDNTPYFYKLSTTTLLLLYNGIISTISSSDTKTVEIGECVSKVSVSSDFIEKQVYAISEDHVIDSITTNSIYSISPQGDDSEFLDAVDLVMSETNSFVCLGGKKMKSSVEYTSLRFIDVFSIDSASKQIILIEEISDSISSYFYLVRDGQNPSTCHKFPGSVSSVTETTPLGQVTAGSTPFRIDRLYSLHDSSPHVLGVGSVVIYSPCLACSWYLLPISHSDADGYRVHLDKAGIISISSLPSRPVCYSNLLRIIVLVLYVTATSRCYL